MANEDGAEEEAIVVEAEVVTSVEEIARAVDSNVDRTNVESSVLAVVEPEEAPAIEMELSPDGVEAFTTTITTPEGNEPIVSEMKSEESSRLVPVEANPNPVQAPSPSKAYATITSESKPDPPASDPASGMETTESAGLVLMTEPPFSSTAQAAEPAPTGTEPKAAEQPAEAAPAEAAPAEPPTGTELAATAATAATEPAAATTTSTEAPVVVPKVPMSAREKAEERRRKILERSGERLGAVSGGTEGKTDTAASPTTANSADDGEPKSNKPSGRLARMRQRRFKSTTAARSPNADAAVAAPSPKTTSPPDATDSEPNQDQSSSSSIAPKNPPTPAEQPSTTTTTDTKPNQSKDTSEPPTVPTEKTLNPPLLTPQETSSPPIVPSSTNNTNGKKYMGVAKMRRKKLAEQRSLEPSGDITTPKQPSIPIPNQRRLALKRTAAAYAAYLHITIIFFLFMSGFLLGSLATTATTNNKNIVVLSGLSPLERTVAGYLDLLGLNNAAVGMQPSVLFKTDIPLEASVVNDDTIDDEFMDTEEGAKKPYRTPNIDPIFRVDLDELTSGPGPLMAAARFAVQCHRLYLSLWTLLWPSSLFSLPRYLFIMPPFPFLFAALIRAVGKRLLGGTLPDLDAAGDWTELAQTTAGTTGGGVAAAVESGDFFSSILKTAKDYIAKALPTAATTLGIFNDARKDMYLVLCGWFVSWLVLTHGGWLAVSSSASEKKTLEGEL